MVPPGSGKGTRLETTIRFSNPEAFLTRMESVLTGEPGAEAHPGSIELTLAERILARQGGTLRVESPGEHDTVIAILLPCAPAT
jgi:hypothetical protein